MRHTDFRHHCDMTFVSSPWTRAHAGRRVWGLLIVVIIIVVLLLSQELTVVGPALVSPG